MFVQCSRKVRQLENIAIFLQLRYLIYFALSCAQNVLLYVFSHVYFAAAVRKRRNQVLCRECQPNVKKPPSQNPPYCRNRNSCTRSPCLVFSPSPSCCNSSHLVTQCPEGQQQEEATKSPFCNVGWIQYFTFDYNWSSFENCARIFQFLRDFSKTFFKFFFGLKKLDKCLEKSMVSYPSLGREAMVTR